MKFLQHYLNIYLQPINYLENDIDYNKCLIIRLETN